MSGCENINLGGTADNTFCPNYRDGTFIFSSEVELWKGWISDGDGKNPTTNASDDIPTYIKEKLQ